MLSCFLLEADEGWNHISVEDNKSKDTDDLTCRIKHKFLEAKNMGNSKY